jgi:hypothetical protein
MAAGLEPLEQGGALVGDPCRSGSGKACVRAPPLLVHLRPPDLSSETAPTEVVPALRGDGGPLPKRLVTKDPYYLTKIQQNLQKKSSVNNNK